MSLFFISSKIVFISTTPLMQEKVLLEKDQFFKDDLDERRKPIQLSLEVFHYETKVSQMETTSHEKVLKDEQRPSNQATRPGIINIPWDGEKNLFQRRSNYQSSNRILHEELNAPSQKASNMIPKQVALPEEGSNVQPKIMNKWKANIDSKSNSDGLLANIKASQEPTNINNVHGIFSKTRSNIVLNQMKKVNFFNNSMVLPLGKTSEQGYTVINAEFKKRSITLKQQMKNVDKNKSVVVSSKFQQAEKTLYRYCGDDLYNTTKLNFSKKVSSLTKVHLLIILNSPHWEVSKVLDSCSSS